MQGFPVPPRERERLRELADEWGPDKTLDELCTATARLLSYLGVPLETAPGLCIGALCAADQKPRLFTESDLRTLNKLASFAVSMIKSYRAALNFNDQLTSAMELQKQMLPGIAQIEAIEASCPLQLANFYRARDGIGGDIWGIEASGPQRVLLYIADFAGHGIAAALNTARFHSFVHMASSRADKPASMLRQLNERLHEVLPAGQFATMFCAALDFRSQTMEYASAGAPPQLYRRSQADPFELLEKPGLPLGIMRSAIYESETVPFRPGGALVLYTDGFIEIPRPPNPAFTPRSLAQLLNAFSRASAAGICDKITGALFADPSISMNDDLTLVVAQHRLA